jgi:ribose/xylose/arabinose/galactoside ABC-type transport system permease subunit
VLGGVNGVLMAYLGIPAIIGSLGMMFVIRSGELVYTHGSEPQILFTLPKSVTDGFLFLGKQTIGTVPALVILAVAMFVLVYALMALTPFGRQAKAVGSNVRAAYLAGIDIRLRAPASPCRAAPNPICSTPSPPSISARSPRAPAPRAFPAR